MSLFAVTPSHVASTKIECQNVSYVYRSRKHWECKYIVLYVDHKSSCMIISSGSRCIPILFNLYLGSPTCIMPPHFEAHNYIGDEEEKMQLHVYMGVKRERQRTEERISLLYQQEYQGQSIYYSKWHGSRTFPISEIEAVRFPVSTLRFQRLVISCFQVTIWLKYRGSDVNLQNTQPTNYRKRQLLCK